MKLHGLAVSNYYNVVKTALLEKGLEFEEIMAPPSQEEDFLAKSPIGKIPTLETNEGFLSETHAILAYLEKSHPTPALIPGDAFLAGRAMQIHQIIDLYIDGSARPLLAAAFFGKEATQAQIEAGAEKLSKGINALARVARFAPYLAGKELSHADLAGFFTVSLAQSIMTRLGAPDPLADLNGYKEYYAKLNKRPAFQRAVRERDQAMAQILAKQSE